MKISERPFFGAAAGYGMTMLQRKLE